MSRKDAAIKVQREAAAILSNILWNVGAVVGSAILVDDKVRATLMNVAELAKDHKCQIDGKIVRVAQLFHHELKPEERRDRQDELYSAAKRMLVADSFEATLIAAHRYLAILDGKADPVESEHGSQPSMDLLSPGRDAEKIGLVKKDEAEFFRDVVAEIRHAITHANGVVSHPEKRKRFGYDKEILGKHIVVGLRPDNEISLQLGMSFDIFEVISEVSARMGAIAVQLSGAE